MVMITMFLFSIQTQRRKKMFWLRLETLKILKILGFLKALISI